MRILLIHSDYLKYKTKSKTRIAEKIEDEKKKGEFEDSLVVFTAVEKEDEKDPEAVVENAVVEVEDIMNKVKAENVVLYPYAHLSSSLSSPDAAKTILKGMESSLKDKGLQVQRVPFGWYKAFEVSCKGHPLSELSRTITAEKAEKKVEEEEEGEKSQFYIFQNGELIDPDEFQYDNRDFEKLVGYELGKLESTVSRCWTSTLVS